MPDGAKGPLAHSFQPASSQIQQSLMRVVTPRGLWCEASDPCPQHVYTLLVHQKLVVVLVPT
jgi:hypothetical protein